MFSLRYYRIWPRQSYVFYIEDSPLTTYQMCSFIVFLFSSIRVISIVESKKSTEWEMFRTKRIICYKIDIGISENKWSVELFLFV